MPAQGFGIGMLTNLLGQINPLAVKCVVMFAVIELFPNSATNREVKLGCHGHVTRVEQTLLAA
jgi:hypothetical protein